MTKYRIVTDGQEFKVQRFIDAVVETSVDWRGRRESVLGTPTKWIDQAFSNGGIATDVDIWISWMIHYKRFFETEEEAEAAVAKAFGENRLRDREWRTV